MLFQRLLILLTGIGLMLALARGLYGAVIAHPATMQIQFLHYAQLGMPEQDVFIEPYNWLDDLPSNFIYPLRPHDWREEIPSNFIEPRSLLAPDVVRIPAMTLAPTYLAKQLYAAVTVIPHEPLTPGAQALGPFAKGDALGLTLRQWLAARGSGMKVATGDAAELRLNFQALVPYGQYALQCVNVPSRSDADSVETDCPDWSSLATRFQPDGEGTATLWLRIPALPEGRPEWTTVLQLVYERAVIKWDGDLGGYGWNEHVQLLFPVPPAQD